MKLRRNTDPDQLGKYILIRTDKLTPEARAAILRDDGSPVTLNREAIDTGRTPRDSFFVLRVRDQFALPALVEYREAVREHGQLQDFMAARAREPYRELAFHTAGDLHEYMEDIDLLLCDWYGMTDRKIPT